MTQTFIPRAGTLSYFLQRNSCLRRPSSERRKEGAEAYKKGWELRIVLQTGTELAKLRRLLRNRGHLPPKAYRKRQQWVQPVYGRAAVKELAAGMRV